MPSLSIVISTYNSPRSLELVLDGILRQEDREFECIVADDGSGDETAAVVKRFAEKRKIIHVWQEDAGFRLAAVRNLALRAASGDIVSFIDGDCIPSPHFSGDAKRLAARADALHLRAYFQGHRVILDADVSARLHSSEGIFSPWWVMKERAHLSNKANAFRYPFPLKASRALKGIRGCNMLFSRKELLEVNGFDEEFIGWGHEDRDIVERLFRAGVVRCDARGCLSVYHLYHPERSRESADENLKRSMEARSSRVRKGIIVTGE